MKPNLISITGADDSVNPQDLLRLSVQHPQAEWAILYFPEKEGDPRNPSAQWRN